MDTFSPPRDVEETLAVSLLWADGSTRTARELKALVDEGPAGVRGRLDGLPAGVLEELAGRRCPEGATAAEAVRVARERARQALARAASAGMSCLPFTSPEYPEWLWHISDPPAALWVVGEAGVLSMPAVAVVGARQATPTGLATAARLGRELSEAGLAVVSGLARGIDGAAHRGALDAGGITIGVLGCGADVVYPAEHRELGRRISDTGALVTEFAPGAEPLPWRFPLRNRIISGLSRAVVVVEASERSGSLITARAALEQGRDVLAVPGSIASGRNRGGHALIRDGARLVESVEDVLEEIGWERRQASPSQRADNRFIVSALEEIMARGEPYTVDELARLTGRPAPDLLADLSGLELAGRVARTGGGSFTKT